MDLDEKIEYIETLNNNKFKMMFINIKWSNNLKLGVLYLQNNEIDKSRNTFKKLKNKEKFIYALYPLFLISIYDNNLIQAEKYLNKLLKIKRKKFTMQKETANETMIMVKNEEYNDKIYNNTNYQILKDICLRYKKIK